MSESESWLASRLPILRVRASLYTCYILCRVLTVGSGGSLTVAAAVRVERPADRRHGRPDAQHHRRAPVYRLRAAS
jgi:hypothetical protein